MIGETGADFAYVDASITAIMTWVLVPFLAGSSDRIFVSLDIPYQRQIEVLRVV